ncbi:TonB-dependent receptor [Phenylobacterium sp. Root1277]|uniref:TonB-dependent receptor n=2 Tax=Phenylobacterium TaxID=20 RepID=UPI001F42FC10|nr:TonB-dependent receptor [Phenylobacterium sp. Root1277]
MLYATSAGAQTSPDTSGAYVEEVVVTAAKRSENLQSVPISVSAITGDSLAQSRVDSVDALVTRVPNLQLSSTVGPNTPIFAVRGVSMSDFSLSQASPVATYYDEVYKGNFALLGVAMYDLERVEVLRGPQGTLYGKNTTGGAVNLISRDAKLGETSGYVDAGYGNYNRVDVNGAVNLPLGEDAALRVAGAYSRADGWFESVTPGIRDLNEVREYGVRATLNYEPTDGVRLKLVGSTSFQNPQNYGIYATPEATNRPGLDTWEIASNIPDRRRARTWSLALHADVDLSDTLTLTSITSWDKGTLRFVEDTDGKATSELEITYGDRASQFAQDVRLTSHTGGPFDFILGAYFNREKVFNTNLLKMMNDLDVNSDGGVDASDCIDSGFIAACQLSNQFYQTKKSYALYTDVKYELGEDLTLRGGLRYTRDDGEQDDYRSAAYSADGVLITDLIAPTGLEYSAKNLSGKIGVDYKLTSNNMIYATISTGYRAPSFNAQAFIDPSEITVAKAEKVTSYEVGAKTQFADRRVTLNMAAFYYDYRNQQFLNIDAATARQQLLNIPKSRIFGGEAELSAYVNQILSVRAGLGLLSTEIRTGTVSGVDVSGNELSNAPGVTANLGLDITIFDSDDGKLSLHPDVAYQSGQYFEVINISRLRQDSYAVLSGHIRYETADGRWNASAWVKNAANEKYFTARIDLLHNWGFDYNQLGAPRTYGISVGAKF